MLIQMSIPPKLIQEFQKLYEARFGIELSEKEALEKGTQLILLMRAVYKPTK